MSRRVSDLQGDHIDLPNRRLPNYQVRSSHVPEVSSRLQQSWVPSSSSSSRSTDSSEQGNPRYSPPQHARPALPTGSNYLPDGSIYPRVPPGFTEAHRGQANVYDQLYLADSPEQSAMNSPIEASSRSPRGSAESTPDMPRSVPAEPRAMRRSPPTEPRAMRRSPPIASSTLNPTANDFEPVVGSATTFPSREDIENIIATSGPLSFDTDPTFAEQLLKAHQEAELDRIKKIEDERDRLDAYEEYLWKQAKELDEEEARREREEKSRNTLHFRGSSHSE
ncbi:hypothetical protein NW762_003616 [Fusarium torreyae]|uniref:Uncharacterized protein n=1 Tax=Fusarium torreyae TaxID=1237075 RepID=A0A9W8S826_9HYPO|nr:hypothetical protein NW762_003616 [Fusarium torreyae]